MEYTTQKKVLSILVLALVVVGIVYLLTLGGGDNKGGVAGNDNLVAVKHTDLSKIETPQDKIPAGMPSNIPVETDIVSESYVMDYKDPDLTQYTMSFVSRSTVQQKLDLYKKFMQDNGFKIEAEDSSTPVKYLLGKKDNDDLTVVISLQGQDTLIQLTFLDRK